MPRRFARLWLLLALPLAAVVGACGEDLETGATCPLLCPGQEIVIRDTVIEPAYEYDSTFLGFPLQGLESPLLLSARGDTLDVRAVIRFDTLVRFWRPVDSDTAVPIDFVDSAFLAFRLTSARVPMPSQFIINAYDVFDSTVVDTLPRDLVPLFTPERLLGSYRSSGEDFVDSTRIRIALDTAMLRAILGEPDRRLHIGLQVTGSSSVQFRITPYTPNGDGATLSYRFTDDSTVAGITGLAPSSFLPRVPAFLAGDLVDFSIVAAAPDIRAPGRFAVGGLPGARAYLRFELPRWLTDSVGVLRARLELTQDPVRGPSDTDTLRLLPHLVTAANHVTDLRRAVTLLGPAGAFANVLELVPSDSGVRLLEMNALVRQWGTLDGVRPLPSALVLRSDSEGSSPLGVRFFGATAADPALRPRLRVSYTPSRRFGRP